MRVDYEEARRILVRFSQYMRANLNTASKSLIPLTEEMDHVDAYLDIVKARFPDRLKIYRKIDDRIMDVLIPSATLQPLVENCIEHGLKKCDIYRCYQHSYWTKLGRNNDGGFR